MPGMRCPWADDLADAKRVAVHLGIPFKVFDFRHEYKQLDEDFKEVNIDSHEIASRAYLEAHGFDDQ